MRGSTVTSATTALRRTLAIAAVGQFLDVAELVVRQNSTRWGPDLYGYVSGVPRRRARVIAVLKCLSAVVPLAPRASRRWVVVFGALRGCLLALDRTHHRYGLDGSDQLQETINAYVVAAHLILESDDAAEVALRAVNAQVAIAYLSSGVVKAISPEWRSGDALLRIARTRAYGSRSAATALERWPILPAVLGWATIASETLFPLSFLLPARFARLAVTAPLLCHLTAAHYMGLPRFFWAFAAGHPALRYVIETRSSRQGAA